MKKNFTILFILGFLTSFVGEITAQTPCVDGMVAGYPCENVDLWSFVPFSDMGSGNFTNDIWGWTDAASRREFALVGKNTGTAFVEITDPANPVYLGSLDTHTENSIWRDIKVYQNYAFIVSEAGGHGMQVFDLTQLLTTTAPQVFEETTYYGGFGHSHNIAINEETGFAYSVGDNNFGGGLDIIDISDPLNPTLAGSFSDDGYTHDCQAVIYNGPDTDYQGKEIVFAANEDNFAIVNVDDKSDCQLISSTTYADYGYTHQCWLTPDQKYLIFGDELDELYGYTDITRTYVYNVEDLDNPYQVTIYEGQTASIDHNLYTVGNMLYQSNYTSGLRIADLGGIENGNLVERGYFDCFPENDDTEFGGTWSNYPYFPSGNVIVTNSESGFFIVRPQIFHLDADVAQIGCASGNADFVLTIPTELTSSSYSLDISGLPGNPEITSDAINVPGTTNITISGLGDLAGGITTFEILLNGDYGQYIIPAAVLSLNPIVPTGLAPANGDELMYNSDPVLTWDDLAGDIPGNYTIYISENSDLSNPIITSPVYTGEYTLTEQLNNGQVYYWAVSHDTECGSEQSPIESFTFSSAVGIDELISNTVEIFPNPTFGKITLKGLSSNTLVNITDITGKIITTKIINSSNATLDLSDLEPGVYFLQAAKNQIIGKVVLK